MSLDAQRVVLAKLICPCRRVGIMTKREKHKGSFDIIELKDAAENTFVTRQHNVFVIGNKNSPMISLPKGKGVRLTILQEQAKIYQGEAKIVA
jgi:small subunit ribosomal protein S4e